MHARVFLTMIVLWACTIRATTIRDDTPITTRTSTRRTSTRTRQIVRTTVLFPPIQDQYRLSDITAELVNQNAGTSTFVAKACSQTTISNNATCVAMPPVTYSWNTKTLVYSEARVGSVNCKLTFKSATPTQTCTVVKPVYASGVITTGTERPTAAALSSSTSVTQWKGTQTGYVYADIWMNDAGTTKATQWLSGVVIALALIVVNFVENLN